MDGQSERAEQTGAAETERTCRANAQSERALQSEITVEYTDLVNGCVEQKDSES